MTRGIDMKIVRTMMVVGVVLVMSSTAMASGNATAGKSKASSCAMCHGADGKGKGTNPPLAGLDAKRIEEQLKAFKSGARKSGMMEPAAKKLSDQDIADLAAYYASLK